MNNIRLFWQIFVAALLIALGAILAGSWYGTRVIHSFYYQQMREDIGNRALLLRPHILYLLDQGHGSLQDFCRRSGRAASTRITVIRGDGRVLADSNEDPARMDNHATRPEILIALRGGIGSSLRYSKTLSRNMLYVAIPLFNETPQKGVLRLSVPATALDAVLADIRRKIIFGTLTIALLAAWLSYLLARRISRPLEEMQQGADRLAAGKTGHPITLTDNHVAREIAELAQSLNSMGEQIHTRIRMIVQQRNELEAVFSSMTDGVLAIGMDHKIIRVNRAAARLFHIDGESVKGKPFEGVIRNQILQRFFRKVLASDKAEKKILTLLEDGGNLNLRIHAVPLFDGENQRMGSLVIINNLTRINQLEHLRQDFVANVSHELKTPITAIRGYVETLLDGAAQDPDAAEKFLRIIDRQGRRLDALVDDLLTLARIEDTAALHEKDLQQEAIGPILEAAIQTCQVQALQKKIKVLAECQAGLTAQVNSSMLEQAIINLVTNAITYSPEGAMIQVRAAKLQDENGKKQILISVQDQGPGIAPEHQERIFERFYRCDKARSRSQGGTGLGLAIVKHVAQAHKGEIQLESRPGHGARFTLVLSGEKRG